MYLEILNKVEEIILNDIPLTSLNKRKIISELKKLDKEHKKRIKGGIKKWN